MTDEQLNKILSEIEGLTARLDRLTAAIHAQTRRMPAPPTTHFIDAEGRHYIQGHGEAGSTLDCSFQKDDFLER